MSEVRNSKRFGAVTSTPLKGNRGVQLMLNNKRGEFFRLLAIFALLVLTVGVVVVLSANNPTTPSKATPSFVNGSANHTINFTVTNPAGSAALKAVRIQESNGFTSLDCAVFVPTDWGCSESSPTTVDFTTGGGGITAGTSLNFSVAATAPATTGNQSFEIFAYENTIGDLSINTTLRSNVTVDTDAPLITAVNITDGTRLWNASAPTMWVSLSDLTLNVTVTDIHSGLIGLSLYFNISNTSVIPNNVPLPTDVDSYDPRVLALSTNGGNRYNVTIPATDLGNGTRLFFTIVANDTVQNRNISNLSTNTYNISIDGAAPTAKAANMTGTSAYFGYNVTSSSTIINLTLRVTDNGGSGVSSVEINTSDAPTTFKTLNLTNNNADSIYNFTGPLSDLGVTTGDHKLRVSVRAIDVVGNTLIATMLDLEVDDDAPQFSINSNVSNNFTNSNSSQLDITVVVSNNLNVSHNVTIFGPNGLLFNMSRRGGTITGSGSDPTKHVFNGSTTWFTVNATQGVDGFNYTFSFSNLSQYGCAQGSGNTDGQACQLQINATDVFGRSNSTNISITLDNLAPWIVNVSTNATSSSVNIVRSLSRMNFTLNAENNIANVTIHNNTATAQLSNGTVAVSFGGTNYSVTVVTSEVCGTGVEGTCIVNFTATDKALNINRTIPTSFTFIVDNGAPLVSNLLVNGSSNGSSADSAIPGSGVRVFNTNTVLNITFNVTDQVTNVTQVVIGNSTLRNASMSGAPDGFQNVSTLAGFGCPTGAIEGFFCIVRVHAIDNLSIDNLANENNSVNLTFQVDNLAPRVVNFSTNLISGKGFNVTSVNTVIRFSVNITDANLPNFNVSIGSTSTVKMNKTTSSFNASNESAVTWTADTNLNDLGCTTDGDCTITVFANDSAGNVNSSVAIIVSSDSSVLALNNRTFGAKFTTNTPTLHINTSANAVCRYSTTGITNYSQMSSSFTNDGSRHNELTLPATSDGAYEYDGSCVSLTGGNAFSTTLKFTIDTTTNATPLSIENRTFEATFLSARPTIHVNTSAPALCRYSTTGVLNYPQMSTQFGTQNSRHNSFTLPADTRDGTYQYDVSCVTADLKNNVSEQVKFTIDTRSLYNITMGSTGSTKVQNDYLQPAAAGEDNGWNGPLYLPKWLLQETGVPTTFNVTNVLASIDGNYSKVLAWNGSDWSSYIPGTSGNTFTNFTFNDATGRYYVNATVVDRLTIN